MSSWDESELLACVSQSPSTSRLQRGGRLPPHYHQEHSRGEHEKVSGSPRTRFRASAMLRWGVITVKVLGKATEVENEQSREEESRLLFFSPTAELSLEGDGGGDGYQTMQQEVSERRHRPCWGKLLLEGAIPLSVFAGVPP